MKPGTMIGSVLLGAVLTGLVLTPSSARADETLPEEARAAVERAVKGALTDEDRELLVTEYPEVAARLPDPEAVETELSEEPAGQASTVSGRSCTTYTGKATQWSLLRSVIYKFKHSATVCADGVRILSHSDPSYTMEEPQWVIDNWEVVDKSVFGVGTQASKSRIQLRVRYCVVKVGCYAVTYPTGVIEAKPNQTADIQTRAA